MSKEDKPRLSGKLRLGASGFSLVEVMVALVVLSLVAGGALGVISQNTRFMAAAEQRLHASILADNILARRLGAPEILSEGVETYETRFGGRAWICREVVVPLGIEGLVRIDLTVSDGQSEQVLVAVSTVREAAP